MILTRSRNEHSDLTQSNIVILDGDQRGAERSRTKRDSDWIRNALNQEDRESTTLYNSYEILHHLIDDEAVRSTVDVDSSVYRELQ